jgi:DnaJ-domain-containing protein 1
MLAGFGLDADQRDVIFPLVDGEEAATEIAQMPREVQEEAFRLLLEAAAADGKIVAEEREYLQEVAKALSISDEELERRLAEQLA